MCALISHLLLETAVRRVAIERMEGNDHATEGTFERVAEVEVDQLPETQLQRSDLSLDTTMSVVRLRILDGFGDFATVHSLSLFS